MTTNEQRLTTFMARCMARLALSCDRFAWWILAITAVLFVLSARYALEHLTYASDRNLVLANSAPYYQAYQDFKHEFQSTDAIFFVIRGPRREVNRQVALDIGTLANADKAHFSNVVDKIDLSFARKRPLLFLPLPELRGIEQPLRAIRPLLARVLAHPGIGPLFSDVNTEVQDWLQSVLSRLKVGSRPMVVPVANTPTTAQAGPEVLPFVNGVPLFVELLKGMRASIEGARYQSPVVALLQPHVDGSVPMEEAHDVWIEFAHGQTVLVSAEPRMEGHDRTASIDATVQAARRIIDIVHGRYPGVEVGLTGTPAIDSDEMRQAESDSTHATLLSLLGVVLLFWAAFHNLTRPLLAMLALVVSLVWTLGFVALTLGHLNLLTVTTLPMLVGLGIDFGIQVISRYEEERKAGLPAPVAMSDTLQHTGASILTAGMTTAVSFGVLHMSGFAGVQELAIVAGGGILIGVFCMIVILPSLILIGERPPFRSTPAQAMRASSWRGLERMEAAILAHPRAVLMVAALFSLFCVSRLDRVRFDWNVLNLQDQTSPSVHEAFQLMEGSNRSILWAAVATDDVAKARVLSERFRALGTVSDVISVAPLLPLDQDEKLGVIKRIQAGLEGLKPPAKGVSALPAVNVPVLTRNIADLRRVVLVIFPEAERVGGAQAGQTLQAFVTGADQLLQTIDAVGQKVAAEKLDRFQASLFNDLFHHLASITDPVEATPITIETLPESLRRQLVGKHGKLMVQVFPAGNVWERPAMAAFLKEVREVAPDATGPAIEVYESSYLVKTNYETVTLYALAAIILLTLIHFQSLGATLLALTPLGAGILWMFGIQGICNIPFNGVNMTALSLILGIGVANGIYIVRRFHEEGSSLIFSCSTGRAILMSNLAAIIGFGSLLISEYRGMFSFGLLMSLGVGMCMVASLVVLPAVLTLPGLQRPAKGISEGGGLSVHPQG